MQMTLADKLRYPKLAQYVRNELPNVVHSPAIVRGMRTCAQLSKVQLKGALKWGQGPRIVIRAMRDFGAFTPGIASSEIRIQQQMVRDFEAGRGARVARAGNVYLVGVTLLHELVHWGDDQDGVDRPGEEGNEFERLVYGAVIG